jgi:hypothetical protein
VPLIQSREAAVRLARAIASDILLYNHEAIGAGKDVTQEIADGYELFRSRVDPGLHEIFQPTFEDMMRRAHPAPRPARGPAPHPERPSGPTVHSRPKERVRRAQRDLRLEDDGSRARAVGLAAVVLAAVAVAAISLLRLFLTR